MVVGGHLVYGSRDEIVFKFTVRNVGSEPIVYDTNQDHTFAMYGASNETPVWTDRTCDVKVNYGSMPTTGVLELEPGDEATYQGTTARPRSSTDVRRKASARPMSMVSAGATRPR
ncbi:MAG: hypothetical protein ACR2H3_03285 [Acidimicrobiales bacterium]